ncbi:ImmA/IrrE family metallo-endopeptidase [Brassicibacter mesophilus]|uniref:ImmA/IrrE family metallo-endopeptidase n=1 Tax=Brassicibacter mesophilus TaxID=745119 RepID=UPI003D21D7A0
MQRYEWIDNCILGLFDIYNSYDVYELYNCLEIKIKKLHKDNILLQGNDAFYQRNYLDEEIVFIRDDLDYKYEKFVLAHELGHAILHTEIYSAAFNKSLLNKGKFEMQSNYFAFKLLDIKIDKNEFEGFTSEQIAKALYVSEECLVYSV